MRLPKITIFTKMPVLLEMLKIPKFAKIAVFPKMANFELFLKIGKNAKMTKIPQNGKMPKNGVFREIPQNWDFGGHGGEHTRKAWCGNYFQNNPWVPILHTSIKGVYFILFVSHWFSVNFIFDYFYKVEENVIKWKKMVVDVQNKVFYKRSTRLYGDFTGTLINKNL